MYINPSPLNIEPVHEKGISEYITYDCMAPLRIDLPSTLPLRFKV